MKKLFALVAVSLSVGLPLALNVPTTAHAAKWHQGTPKVLRGTWERMETVGKGQNAFKAKMGVQVTKKRAIAYFIGDPFVLKKMQYQKTSKHVYVLKGTEALYTRKPTMGKIRIHQVGKRLKFQAYEDFGKQAHYEKMSAWLVKK